VIKGAGEMASGVAFCLHTAGFKRLLMLELAEPQAVRRNVCFCEAIYDDHKTVEGVTAAPAADPAALERVWRRGEIAVRVDPDWRSVALVGPEIVVDATLAKRNLGTGRDEARLVIAMGPGFTAGRDAHVVVETQRGHLLGRLLTDGRAIADTGIPGSIAGVGIDRVLRSPAQGSFEAAMAIGDVVAKGDLVGTVSGQPVHAAIDGVIRGLIRPGIRVAARTKLGDIDPRGEIGYVDVISDKARALGGAVLTSVLHHFNR